MADDNETVVGIRWSDNCTLIRAENGFRRACDRCGQDACCTPEFAARSKFVCNVCAHAMAKETAAPR